MQPTITSMEVVYMQWRSFMAIKDPVNSPSLKCQTDHLLTMTIT